MNKAKKYILGTLALIGVGAVGLMFSSADACGERCIARHLLLAASKSRTEVDAVLTKNVNVVERKIQGPYVEGGHIGPAGNVLVVNSSKGIVVALEPIRKGNEVVWRCFIYPDEMQALLANEKCQGN